MAWEKRQAKSFVKAAKAKAGAGWDLLGQELQEALVAREMVYVLIGQALPTMDTGDVEKLWQEMLCEAGLSQDAEQS